MSEDEHGCNTHLEMLWKAFLYHKTEHMNEQCAEAYTVNTSSPHVYSLCHHECQNTGDYYFFLLLSYPSASTWHKPVGLSSAHAFPPQVWTHAISLCALELTAGERSPRAAGLDVTHWGLLPDALSSNAADTDTYPKAARAGFINDRVVFIRMHASFKHN